MLLTLGCIFTLGSIVLIAIVGFGPHLISNKTADTSPTMRWGIVQIIVSMFCAVVFVAGVILLGIHFVVN